MHRFAAADDYLHRQTMLFERALNDMTRVFLNACADANVDQCDRIARIAQYAHKQIVPMMLPDLTSN